MAENNVVAPETKLNDYVICPYDSTHRLIPSRLTRHLIRCARNFPSTKKVRHPFNSNHIHSVAEMKANVETCPDRSKMEYSRNPLKLPQEEPKLPNFCVESTEDWDAEPPAGTYNPQDHCERELIIRNPQGNPPAARREFRERERRRFNENNPF
ncbi:gametocyte-specific factor 1 homolog [Drosophila kikkawai]|uniref:Gametocyte-specific factor 1 homolog n=1 Tax=Drosophila kikkawai TaxID=30033 RepID=A0A6P4HT22_DROKI|nr:gametocyte-specific factor 1 homolog [Drosophila kikkawai]XP_017019198.1 gametocyte-specific factor 1 homolog [Drosophila kikkawai]